jgi:hypothetical protein
MTDDYKKIDLFGKTLMQKLVLTAPFKVDIKVAEQACFFFVKEGEFEYKIDDEKVNIPTNYALFLNCVKSTIQIPVEIAKLSS